MSSEIPVVLKPQGFAETKQGADGASVALAKLGSQFVSIDKLGETVKKLGPVTLAVTAGFAAANTLIDRWDQNTIGATESTIKLTNAMKQLGNAREAALAGAGDKLASFRDDLRKAADQGVGESGLLELSKKYGLSLPDAAKLAGTGVDPQRAATEAKRRGIGIVEAAQGLPGRAAIADGSQSPLVQAATSIIVNQAEQDLATIRAGARAPLARAVDPELNVLDRAAEASDQRVSNARARVQAELANPFRGGIAAAKALFGVRTEKATELKDAREENKSIKEQLAEALRETVITTRPIYRDGVAQ